MAPTSYPTGTAPRAWTALMLGGIALWIIATLVAGRSGGDSAATQAFVLAGTLFFGFVFGYSFWQNNRSSYQRQVALYQRLAVAPVPPGLVRRSLRGHRRAVNVYLAFGAIVTTVAFLAVLLGRDGDPGGVLWVVVGIALVWCIVAIVVASRGFTSAAALMVPLGLTVTSTPGLLYLPGVERVYLIGASTYSGHRHGREVTVVQSTNQAITVVRGVDAAARAPADARAMVALTGEPARTWKGVEARVVGGDVIVIRNGANAGTWFLQDLLLAETIAAQGD